MKWTYKYDGKGNKTNWNCFDAKRLTMANTPLFTMKMVRLLT